MGLKNKIKKNATKIVTASVMSLSTFAMTITPTFAATTGVESLNTFMTTFIAPWLVAIGGVIALVGGVMFALGWQREDAEGKTKGLMTVMAGFMILGLGAGGYTVFTK